MKVNNFIYKKYKNGKHCFIIDDGEKLNDEYNKAMAEFASVKYAGVLCAFDISEDDIANFNNLKKDLNKFGDKLFDEYCQGSRECIKFKKIIL